MGSAVGDGVTTVVVAIKGCEMFWLAYGWIGFCLLSLDTLLCSQLIAFSLSQL